MAELIVLSYRPGNTFLHRLDIRCKLFILLLTNILSLNASFHFLVPVSLLLAALFVLQKIPLKATLYQTRLFFFLLLFVFISRSVFVEGDVLFRIASLTVSNQGIEAGSLYCWRLILVLVGGILLISTSKTVEIKAGIQWFLKPIPFVPEKQVAMMISLMIRFLPLVLEQGREISDAQKSRAVERVKNPIRRLSLYSIPLLRRIFETAERLVLAMEARSYSETRTDPELNFKPSDIAVFTAATAFTLSSFFF